MSSVFNFLFDLIQLETRSIGSSDNVISFILVFMKRVLACCCTYMYKVTIRDCIKVLIG